MNRAREIFELELMAIRMDAGAKKRKHPKARASYEISAGECRFKAKEILREIILDRGVRMRA